jgi:hypothetical protein
MRSRNSVASSTAESFLAASAADKFAQGGNDQIGHSTTLGTRYKPSFRFRRHGLELGAAVDLGHPIGAQALHHVDGMGHRLDAGGIDGLQLFDETEDAVELFARGFALGGGKLDAGQKGNAGNVFRGQGHGGGQAGGFWPARGGAGIGSNRQAR